MSENLRGIYQLANRAQKASVPNINDSCGLADGHNRILSFFQVLSS